VKSPRAIHWVSVLLQGRYDVTWVNWSFHTPPLWAWHARDHNFEQVIQAICVCVRVCMCLLTCTCLCVRVCVCLCVRANVYMCGCMGLRIMYTCMCVCVNLCVCVCARMYVAYVCICVHYWVQACTLIWVYSCMDLCVHLDAHTFVWMFVSLCAWVSGHPSAREHGGFKLAISPDFHGFSLRFGIWVQSETDIHNIEPSGHRYSKIL